MAGKIIPDSGSVASAGKPPVRDVQRENRLDEIRAIRRALVAGLVAFGDVELLDDKVELCNLSSITIPSELKPLPTSECVGAVVSDFAYALTILETMEERVQS